jgi:aryl-alcohol dehydrogenase-like predicted oxidoreductase
MFILGTAQFGFPYAGSKSLFSVPEIQNILGAAFNDGVRELDTAITYGNSEALLGSADVTKFFVNTKLPPSIDQNETSIEKILDLSLSRLKLQQINTLFIHDVEKFLAHKHCMSLYRSMEREKARGRISSIGISVYSKDEIDRIHKLFKVDQIQATFNFFDDRFYALQREQDYRHIKWQFRSLFLQGTLVNKSLRQNLGFDQQFAQFDNCVKSHNFNTALEFCIAYALNHIDMKNCILGVRNLVDLGEIVKTVEAGGNWPKMPLSRYSIANEILVNPARWNRT